MDDLIEGMLPFADGFIDLSVLRSTDVDNRKEVILCIPVDKVVGILSGRVLAFLPPDIPKDAKAIRSFQHSPTNTICVLLTHPDFHRVKPGQALPQYELVIKEEEPEKPPIKEINRTVEADEREV